MRLLSILTVTLFAATASADPRTLPFEVVHVLSNTQQVLVYDRAHDTHVLLTAGSSFEDYLVVEISGIGVTMESQQERFTVYPRAARGLALHLEPNENRLPAVYSKVEPAPVPAQVADRGEALGRSDTRWPATERRRSGGLRHHVHNVPGTIRGDAQLMISDRPNRSPRRAQ